jgi:NAD(P)-dependent dehydrogenase (short-subunit alcohol dehydrogenase family)
VHRAATPRCSRATHTTSQRSTAVTRTWCSPSSCVAPAAAISPPTNDLDILVNNVGGSDADADAIGGFLDIDDRLWRRSFDLNFFATVRMSRAMLPGLLRRGGVIVNVSSIGARMPGEGPMP